MAGTRGRHSKTQSFEFCQDLWIRIEYLRVRLAKSLLLLSLIANEFARRIHGLGQSGGGRGTGIEPSPGTPS
jgi:hypothetical protein